MKEYSTIKANRGQLTIRPLNLCRERWRAIPGCPDYEASTFGRIRSWKKRRNKAPIPTEPRLVKPITGKLGYDSVCLRINNKQSSRRVNRLILLTWRPNGKGVCRHLNGIRTDNRLINLKWGTYKENTEDARKHGTFPIGEKVHNAKLCAKDVREIRLSNLSVKELAIKYGVTNTSIRYTLKGRLWSHVK